MQPSDLPSNKFEKLSRAAVDFWVLGNPALPEDPDKMSEEEWDQLTREALIKQFSNPHDDEPTPEPCSCERWRKIRDAILAEE